MSPSFLVKIASCTCRAFTNTLASISDPEWTLTSVFEQVCVRLVVSWYILLGQELLVVCWVYLTGTSTLGAVCRRFRLLMLQMGWLDSLVDFYYCGPEFESPYQKGSICGGKTWHFRVFLIFLPTILKSQPPFPFLAFNFCLLHFIIHGNRLAGDHCCLNYVFGYWDW